MTKLERLIERREALCASILSAPDLRKRDMLRGVQAEIQRLLQIEGAEKARKETSPGDKDGGHRHGK